MILISQNQLILNCINNLSINFQVLGFHEKHYFYASNQVLYNKILLYRINI